MNYGVFNGVRIVSEPSSALMQRPFVKVEDLRYYGLGLRIAQDLIAGETMVGHTGSASGLRSAMFFEPHKKFGFVVIVSGMNTVMEDGYIALIKQTISTLHDYFIKK